MAGTPATTGRCIPAWPKDALRITFGVIWLIDAILKWLRFRSGYMGMIMGRPAFPGAALWFPGNPTPAGMHAGTLTFTASTPGSYWYLCPVPGHGQKGMTGTFTVSPS